MKRPPDLFVDKVLDMVVAAVRKGGASDAALDDLPMAIYVTDADGIVTYFNRACVGLAGRNPVIGGDRWCVTWNLYTDAGDFLPHDKCPMAQAIRTGRKIRGVTVMVERPDGSRANVLPCPTPILGEDGALLGAVNLLIDITDQNPTPALRGRANHRDRLH